MTMRRPRTPRSSARTLGATLLSLLAIVLLSACGSNGDSSTAAAPAAAGAATGTAAAGATAGASASGLNTTPDQDRIVPAKVEQIAARLPAEIRERGVLEVGVASVGPGYPPQSFPADDHKTLIGSELDIATLAAGVLGLRPVFHGTSFEGLFVGLDSGKYDVLFSNITNTEERQEKYDFATYREDDVAFEAGRDADWTVAGPADVAGRTIAVAPGTSQEKILRDWVAQNEAAGLDETKLKFYADTSQVYLALGSGQVDALLGPSPAAAYHSAVSGKTKVVGTVSGAGDDLQGLVGSVTLKGDGLAQPLADALAHVVENGDYAKVLARWKLEDEAVETVEVNPPGLPKEKR